MQTFACVLGTFSLEQSLWKRSFWLLESGEGQAAGVRSPGPSRDMVSLFQLGPATSLWSPAGTRARTSPSSYSFSELCYEDRGLWKRTVASACFISLGLATGTLRTVLEHRMEVVSRPGCSRLLDRDVGGPYGILHWLLDPERHCTGIVGVFFSLFKVWHLQAEKSSERDLPFSPTSVPRVLSCSSLLLLGGEEWARVTQLSVWKKPCVKILSFADRSS